MNNTQNNMRELKKKVTELVLFMKENNFNSASLKIENIGDYIFCDVLYNSDDNNEQEFSYLIDAVSKNDLTLDTNEDEIKEAQNADFVTSALIEEDSNDITSSLPLANAESDDAIVEDTNQLVDNDKLNNEGNSSHKITDDFVKTYPSQFKVSTDTSCEKESTSNIDYNKSDGIKNNTKNINQPEDELTEDKSKDNNPQSSGGKTRKVIDYNEELIYQKNVIERILREHNLIA